jgi:hypothetical protein
VPQARVAPAGVVIVSVTAAVLEVMVLPPASWMATTGWAGKAMPPVELAGLVVKPSFVAGPTDTVKFRLVVVKPAPVAVRVYVPARLILHPEKTAVPAAAVTGFAAQLRTAPAGEPVMPRVTGAVLAVVLPPASWMATTGWAVKATPPVEAEGCPVNPSLVAAPAAMTVVLLTVKMSPAEVAVSV